MPMEMEMVAFESPPMVEAPSFEAETSSVAPAPVVRKEFPETWLWENILNIEWFVKLYAFVLLHFVTGRRLTVKC